MDSWSGNTAAYFAWALPRQAKHQPAKNLPFQNDFSVPTNHTGRKNARLQRVFIVDSNQQCYLVEGGKFKQPWLPGFGSAILRVGMRPHGSFEGMRVWGLPKTLDNWSSSSDETKRPQFRNPEGESRKKVSFEGESGRWSIHEIRAYLPFEVEEEEGNPSSLFLPLDEAVLIQPNTDERFDHAGFRQCKICRESYPTANPALYIPVLKTGYEIRFAPWTCPRRCVDYNLIESQSDALFDMPVGPNALGPLNKWSDIQRWYMKEHYSQSPDLPIETAEDIYLAGETEESSDSEESTTPTMDGMISSADESESEFKVENSYSRSLVNDFDEDWF